jgi:hypothetical protein
MSLVFAATGLLNSKSKMKDAEQEWERLIAEALYSHE